ncbi:SCO family protein [Halostagnicola sp. A-GB9-2]|uniref:SCO family protein n=1 Tax=Halostagnicola sp. A-GB9-2 TaxID=3048066 RepID=UPI0024C0ACAC|nr:SCO family protein [Halostagnicola sp. A-GB9-2]MDJ1434100.1 SCO family protein [Halostagnicola sp. A-GB9-2]
MDRRSYLGSLAGVGSVGLAGCLDSVNFFDDSETALSPPDREQDLSDAVHPIHGDEFPSFSIPDPIADEAVSRDDFVGDRAFLMTFIFTSCTNECGTLVNLLRLVQEDAFEEGYEDNVAFLSMTFDPETDDVDALREYGQRYDADIEAENWRFLRPETQDEALELVNDTFGAPVEVQPPEEGEHNHGDGDEGDDGNESTGDAETDSTGEHDESDQSEDAHDDSHGDDHEHDDDDEETSTHYYMIFLVNQDGIVERSYPYAHLETPTELIDDVRAVVE